MLSFTYYSCSWPPGQCCADRGSSESPKKPGSIWGDFAGYLHKLSLGEPRPRWAPCAASVHKEERNAVLQACGKQHELGQEGRKDVSPSISLLSLEDLLSIQLAWVPCCQQALQGVWSRQALWRVDLCLSTCLCSSNCKETRPQRAPSGLVLQYARLIWEHVRFQVRVP